MDWAFVPVTVNVTVLILPVAFASARQKTELSKILAVNQELFALWVTDIVPALVDKYGKTKLSPLGSIKAFIVVPQLSFPVFSPCIICNVFNNVYPVYNFKYPVLLISESFSEI